MEKLKKIEKKILKRTMEIIEKKLISNGDKILIAFSGGPDSIFLYNFLKFLKSRILIEISLVYVNHNLRIDVENDLKFVKKFAAENNVDCYIQSVDVKKYSKENKKSLRTPLKELRFLHLRPDNHSKVRIRRTMDGSLYARLCCSLLRQIYSLCRAISCIHLHRKV